MAIEIIFDVETQKLFSDILTEDPADLGISVVSVYKREVDELGNELNGEMKTFWHPSASLSPVIQEMWEWFEQADRIIGFNSKHFDVPALRPHYDKDFSVMPHFDILEKVKNAIGRRISLNALAQETLGDHKIDVGTNAVYYWANRSEENVTKLKMYCESDVRITKDLYDFGRKNKHVKYMDTKWNTLVTVPIDFSYPPKIIESQIGLF
jgi:DEAD/DEAH box helicase domain-containing protein